MQRRDVERRVRSSDEIAAVSTRVRMLWRCEDAVRSPFDDAAAMHDGSHMRAQRWRDQPKVVDEQIGQAEAFLQIRQQRHDLCLHGDVQRTPARRESRTGLTAGARRQTDALPLSTTELAGISIHGCRIESDEVEQLRDRSRRLCLCPTRG